MRCDFVEDLHFHIRWIKELYKRRSKFLVRTFSGPHAHQCTMAVVMA